MSDNHDDRSPDHHDHDYSSPDNHYNHNRSPDNHDDDYSSPDNHHDDNHRELQRLHLRPTVERQRVVGIFALRRRV